MLTVWRKAELFDPARARAATWIFTIARNRRIDALRRDSRPLPVPEISLAGPDPERPDDLLEARQDEGRVRAALRSLKPDQIEVIQMAFFQDLTHAEVAQSLALPLGTVKSRIRNAMIKLRELLDQPVGEQS
jgi:RNA polymerase sigma-70 factor (ECF subfamily)